MANASPIQYKTLNQLVQIQSDYITANAPVVLTTPLGPFITAIIYATALVGLVLQRLIQLVLAASRLSTSQGTDVDSYVADFNLSRLPGAQASGEVSLGRFTTSVSQILIPLGAIVQTSDNPPIQFAVVGDPTNPNFNSQQNGYLMTSGSVNIVVLVQAILPGANGNVLAGVINSIGSALPGIDTVTNFSPFLDGADPETDDQLKARFALYIQSLSKATKPAILSAIDAVNDNLVVSLFENVNNDGSTNFGQFIVAVDDGTGSPNATLLNNVALAVNLVRPIAVRALVNPSGITVRQGVFVIVIAYDNTQVPNPVLLSTLIENAIITYINTLPFQAHARTSKLYQAIWGILSPGDAVSTVISSAQISSTNTLFVATTTGMSPGQFVQITGFSTASGVLPTIVSMEDNVSITINPPLLTAPPANTVIQAFSIIPGQILNINDLAFGLEKSFAFSTANNLGGGQTGSAVNGTYSGVTGVATKIWAPTLAPSVNDLLMVSGYQPDPNTIGGLTSTNRVKVVALDNPNGAVIVQPPLGVLNADGTWTPLQSPAGNNAIMPVGSSVFTYTAGGESDLAPSGSIVTQLARTSGLQVEIVMTPTVAP